MRVGQVIGMRLTGLLCMLALGGSAVAETIDGALEAADPTLQSGETYDSYPVPMQAGQRVTIELTSQAFDTYLILLTPDGQQFENDDFEGSTQRSRMVYTAAQAGEHILIVTSYNVGESGTYRLTVEAEGEQEQAGGAGAPAGEGRRWGEQPEQAGVLPELMVLTPTTVRDETENIDALSVMVPEGWQQDFRVLWDYESTRQAAISGGVFDPQSGLAVRFYAADAYVQLGQMAQQLLQGQAHSGRYLGHRIAPVPRDPAELVRMIVFPQLPAGAQAEVVSTTPMPELAQAYTEQLQAQQVQGQGMAGRVRIRYQAEMGAVEEDVMVVYTVFDAAGNWMWSPEELYGLRAAEGSLDQARPMLLHIAGSLRFEERWHGYLTYVRQLFHNNVMGQIEAARRLSRLYAQHHEEISQMQRDSFDLWNETSSRAHERTVWALRGMSIYRAPNGQRVAISNSHNHVYVGPNGQYYHSSTPISNAGEQGLTALEQTN